MIKYLVMDVDGTLTDGKIYMGQDGEMAKAFSIKDGAGITLVLPKQNIIPIIITARESRILEKRCQELKITELHQGVKDKLGMLKDILKRNNDGLSSVAYAGDDIPDIPCMETVKKSGGLTLCPADAIPEIKALADYVSGYNAGNGAIRDCINHIIQKKASDANKRVNDVIGFILNGAYQDTPKGLLPEGSIYTIQEYTTKEESECVLETHRNHIVVQYMIEGHEKFHTYMINSLTSTGKYNSETDTEYWQDGILSSHSILVPGSLVVVYHGQPHKGAIQCGKPERVRKLICKISV